MRARSLLLIVAVATFGAASANASLARTATATGVIAYGYPYTHRCPGAGIAKKVDRWGMYMCNCTSYVAWALGANGQRIDWFVPGAMDAKNWANVARHAKIAVGAVPRVGAVAVWPRQSRFGHVAYVTRIEPDGSFDVSEYNPPGEEGIDPFAFDVRRGVTRDGALFVYVPARSS